MKRSLWVAVALLPLLLVATSPVSAGEKDKNKHKEKEKEKATICHMPGTADQKTMRVPKKSVAGHLAHGDHVGACSTESAAAPAAVPPAPSPVPSDSERTTLCHKPGTPAQTELSVDAGSVADHLGHGDYLGTCTDPPPTPPAPPVPSEPAKVTLCHKPGTPAEKMLSVDAGNLADHLGHGDYVGPCTDQPPPVVTPTDPAKIAICHKPGTLAEQTLRISPEDLAVHLEHGDFLGFCGEEPPPLEEWVTPYIRHHHSARPVPV